MSDVTQFIEAIGADISTTVVPKVESLAEGVRAKALTDYLPRVSAVANDLVKQIIEEQSSVLTGFVASAIADLFQRYQPELGGQVRTAIVSNGLELHGEGVRLDVKRRDTGALVASLDIPIAIRIDVPPVDVVLQQATVKLDVIK